MKRKKWSELEEQTLLIKYSELLNSGTLSKLKTREKKFKPIADHVNSVHHLQDPINYPFKWSWRDVSIKVQNMRHQYLGVKQKIRVSDGDFNWDDGVNHWENFMKYKEVFGDVELEVKGKKFEEDIFGFDKDDDFGFGFEIDSDEDDLVGSDGEFGSEGGEIGDLGYVRGKRLKKGIGGNWSKVLDLRDLVVVREGRRREMEWSREEGQLEREDEKRDKDLQKEKKRNERDECMEMEMDEMHMRWVRRGSERISRLERELHDERTRRLKMEEKWEEEEMEWRERMVELQVQHEKQMMQIHAKACQNQMQILGVMARLVCQFYGTANDGLSGGLGALPPQVLQNLQDPGDLGGTGKPDANSPSEFI